MNANGFPVYNILDFGAVPDGHTLNTKGIQSAIAACAAAGGGTVYAPPGIYVSGSLYLHSHVTLYLEAGAVLQASSSLADYALEGGSAYDDDRSGESPYAGLITCRDVVGVTITGRGMIDGAALAFHDRDKMHAEGDFDSQYTRQGANYMHPRFGNQHSPLAHAERPGNLLRFFRCRNVLLQSVTIQNSPTWTQSFQKCDDVCMIGLNINSHASDRRVPNDDGMDLRSCRCVRISDCNIQTSDDCIAIFSGEDITVTNCTLKSRSAGVRVGFIWTDLKNCTFNNLNIESNRGIIIAVRGENSIENLLFSNIIIRTQLFTGHWWGQAEPIHISAIPSYADAKSLGRIKNLRFANIYAESESGILVHGCAEKPIQDLTFDNIHLRLKDGPLQTGYGGNFDLRSASDPRQALFAHDIPGLYGRYVDGLRVNGFRVDWDESLPDFFSHGLELEDAQNIIIQNFEGRQPQATGAAIHLNRVSDISICNSKAAQGTDTFLACRNVVHARLFANNDLLHARIAIQPDESGFTLANNLRSGD